MIFYNIVADGTVSVGQCETKADAEERAAILRSRGLDVKIKEVQIQVDNEKEKHD